MNSILTPVINQHPSIRQPADSGQRPFDRAQGSAYNSSLASLRLCSGRRLSLASCHLPLVTCPLPLVTYPLPLATCPLPLVTCPLPLVTHRLRSGRRLSLATCHLSLKCSYIFLLKHTHHQIIKLSPFLWTFKGMFKQKNIVFEMGVLGGLITS